VITRTYGTRPILIVSWTIKIFINELSNFYVLENNEK